MSKLSICFVLVMLLSACSSESRKGSVNESQGSDPVVATENLKTIEFDVEGMTCGGCENSVEKKVTESGGIAEISASHTDRKAYVTFDSLRTSPDRISEAIANAGYEVTGFREIPQNEP
jgi:copper chaperone CopZ